MRYRAIVIGFVMFALLTGRAGAGELKIVTPVTDLAYGQVYDVDQETGFATEISPAASGSARYLDSSYDIAFGPDGRLIAAQTYGDGDVVAIDPSTGLQER